MPNHWVFTCNPKRWDVWGFMDEGNSLSDIVGWSAARYLKDIAVGDDAAFWVSGKKRGVYAVGVVAGPPGHGVGDEHWVDEEDGDRPRDFVPLDLHTDLSEAPLLADELKADPRFADASIITVPRAANPHRLDDLQWQAIVERVRSQEG